MKQLPIGRQDFATLREKNCLYVDKTEHIYRLLTTSAAYFLSRPRRFGKSVTISTIKAIYEGKKEFFEGLWIEDKWDWSRRNPVIHIPFNVLDYKTLGLENVLVERLKDIGLSYGITLTKTSMTSVFEELVIELAKNGQRVAILIDEYDKPIIDNLETKNRPQAEENRAILRNFYSPIKSLDPYIELLFITGVSKFSQVGIFSHLNHLDDITLGDKFGTLVGYTPEELLLYFEEYIVDFLERKPKWTRERLLDTIREWYNGYSWDNVTTVYNPFSILNFFSKSVFQDYWFKSGTPRFLIDILKERRFFNLNDIKATAPMFESYEIEHLEARAILFQTGYLTIKDYDEDRSLYTLDYPNREVEESMHNHLIAALRGIFPVDSRAPVIAIEDAFLVNDVEKVVRTINAMLKDVPSQIIDKKDEHFYHALVHLHFKFLGIYMDSEVNTSDGRMDAVVKTPNHIYILEFKIDQTAQVALDQIKNKDYPAKYATDPRPTVGIGINFNTEKKSVDDWKMADF
jgi:Predicted AAA-ATPase/PD-(D/E)XK nuclease superfamily